MLYNVSAAFTHKWSGIGFVHPSSTATLQQAIHWDILATQDDPQSITIFSHPDIIIVNHILQNSQIRMCDNFMPNTLKYYESTIPPELDEPRFDPLIKFKFYASIITTIQLVSLIKCNTSLILLYN